MLMYATCYSLGPLLEYGPIPTGSLWNGPRHVACSPEADVGGRGGCCKAGASKQWPLGSPAVLRRPGGSGWQELGAGHPILLEADGRVL